MPRHPMTEEPIMETESEKEQEEDKIMTLEQKGGDSQLFQIYRDQNWQEARRLMLWVALCPPKYSYVETLTPMSLYFEMGTLEGS